MSHTSTAATLEVEMLFKLVARPLSLMLAANKHHVHVRGGNTSSQHTNTAPGPTPTHLDFHHVVVLVLLEIGSQVA